MSLSSAFTIEDLERARKYNGHLTRFCGLGEPCKKCWDYAILIGQVRAEAQQAFSAECGRFHNEGPKCATCGRSDRDARLAAAEKLGDEVGQYAERKGEAWRVGEGTEIMDAYAAWKEAAGK